MREVSEPWFVGESGLYAKVGRMRPDVAMEVVSPDLGVLCLEVR